jgi:hypothetical protein
MFHRICKYCTIKIKNKYICLLLQQKKIKGRCPMKQYLIVGIALKLPILDKLNRVDIQSIYMQMRWYIPIPQI